MKRVSSPRRQALLIGTRPVDADIGKYVSSELLRDPKLRRLDRATKALIEETFVEKADRM
jgi:hypothetical protein